MTSGASHGVPCSARSRGSAIYGKMWLSAAPCPIQAHRELASAATRQWEAPVRFAPAVYQQRIGRVATSSAVLEAMRWLWKSRKPSQHNPATTVQSPRRRSTPPALLVIGRVWVPSPRPDQTDYHRVGTKIDNTRPSRGCNGWQHLPEKRQRVSAMTSSRLMRASRIGRVARKRKVLTASRRVRRVRQLLRTRVPASQKMSQASRLLSSCHQQTQMKSRRMRAVLKRLRWWTWSIRAPMMMMSTAPASLMCAW